MGQVFGDYELLRHIATGGMAEIFLARRRGGLDRVVIIKRMLPELAVRPDFVEMFVDEARLTASLQHPHVVRVEELGQVDNAYFIAMELVDGPHLGALFAHSLRARKPLPIELCTWIVARAADGLDYAHTLNDPATGKPLRLVHRDISPQNILVSKNGEVKVTDFGVAKASTQQTKTRTGIVKGKVSYMSPEQCLGDVIDHRTDVFALGVVLYELLTRRRLFRDKSDLLVMQRITNEDVPPPSTINSSVDATLDAIVKKSLERDAARRYQSAADFAEALDAWLLKAGRQADELTLSQWFAGHCAELAPTATLTLEPSNDQPFAPPLAEPTSATPSYTTRGVTPPPAGPEATTITAPPTFEEPRPPAPTPVAPAPADPSPATVELAIPSPPSQEPSPAPRSPGRLRPAPLLAAAGVAVLVLAAVVVGVGRNDPPPPPPAPPVAAAPARLVVRTTPSDVPIVVGDRVVGRSPVTVEREAGPVVVQAQFPDQPVQTREVVVTAGDETIVEFLARVPVVIRTKPPRAKVRIDGELLGETPFERGYLVPPHTPLALRLDPPGPAWGVVEQAITAMPGVPLVLDLELPSARKAAPVDAGMGLLSIRTDPDGVVVSIGRERLEETPFAERPVKAGRQVLILQKPDIGLDHRLPVTIPKDKLLVVKLKFERDGGTWKVSSKTIR
jgi:eukaryotic-like serine/threonine-protein kinase